MRASPLVTLLTVVLTGCGGSPISAAPSSRPSPSPSGSTELVADIDVGGGRTMHLVCVGPTDTGEPTILIEAGGGLDHTSWGEVLPVMQSTHRLCAYDRAGLGLSKPPNEQSRTAANQVADLHALLEAAGVTGPFGLGAHSYGAIIATVFTQTYPDDIVGLVFVDPQAPRTARVISRIWPRSTRQTVVWDTRPSLQGPTGANRAWVEPP